MRAKFNHIRLRQITVSQDNLLKRFIFDQEFAYKMANHPLHACIGQWLPKGQGEKVLEVGCGPGKYVALLSTLGFNVVGVDPYKFPTWDILRKETSSQLLDNVFAEELPFEDQAFEHVVCLGALLYFREPKKALAEIYRVVKPGAKVIIRTVNKNNLYTLFTGKKLDPASYNLYSMSELINLIENSGLIVSKNFSYGFYPPIGTDLWWYLVCVWIAVPIQHVLSFLLKPENKVNNIVFAFKK